MHFVHVRPVQKAGQTVLPLMMVHGWPGSFYEFYRILPLLTKTDSNVVFEVICPSIPGYGYSEAPHKKGKSANMQRVIARTYISTIICQVQYCFVWKRTFKCIKGGTGYV